MGTLLHAVESLDRCAMHGCATVYVTVCVSTRPYPDHELNAESKRTCVWKLWVVDYGAWTCPHPFGSRKGIKLKITNYSYESVETDLGFFGGF